MIYLCKICCNLLSYIFALRWRATNRKSFSAFSRQLIPPGDGVIWKIIPFSGFIFAAPNINFNCFLSISWGLIHRNHLRRWCHLIAKMILFWEWISGKNIVSKLVFQTKSSWKYNYEHHSLLINPKIRIAHDYLVVTPLKIQRMYRYNNVLTMVITKRLVQI